MDGTLLDARGQLDLPRLEKILDQLDQRGIRFVIATGNEIHRMRQLLGHLVERVVLVVANGARIFENNELIRLRLGMMPLSIRLWLISRVERVRISLL